MGQLIQAYESSNPATPSSGFGSIFPKTDGNLYFKNAAGQVFQINLVGATQTANTFFAGPTSGGATTPTFRAITYADLPTGVGPGKPRVSTVTYSATVTLDCSTADIFYIALTGNIAITFSNGTDGQKIEVRTKQDATGGRTVTFSNGTYGTTITSVNSAASTAANKRDKWGFEFDGTATTYDAISFAGGY